jgi:hypothetical protein
MQQENKCKNAFLLSSGKYQKTVRVKERYLQTTVLNVHVNYMYYVPVAVVHYTVPLTW